jgi:hypothetical protein
MGKNAQREIINEKKTAVVDEEKKVADEEKKNNRFSFIVGIVIAMAIIILFTLFFR